MNESELLFSEILNCDRAGLYRDRGVSLAREKSAFAAAVLRRRIKGEPIQYILGKSEFFGLEFKVNPAVLIPRPETEILAEKTIELVCLRLAQEKRIDILEIGTGSGCLAVSLAKALPRAKITATDISQEALEVARFNAARHNAQISFLHSDIFGHEALPGKHFDIIVSNPPYVSSAELSRLQPEIGYEPSLALDGGNDGLAFYRRIIRGTPEYLKKDGLLILEIGYNQLEAVEKLITLTGDLAIIEVAKDYSNIDRVLVAKFYAKGAK